MGHQLEGPLALAAWRHARKTERAEEISLDGLGCPFFFGVRLLQLAQFFLDDGTGNLIE